MMVLPEMRFSWSRFTLSIDVGVHVCDINMSLR